MLTTVVVLRRIPTVNAYQDMFGLLTIKIGRFKGSHNYLRITAELFAGDCRPDPNEFPG